MNRSIAFEIWAPHNIITSQSVLRNYHLLSACYKLMIIHSMLLEISSYRDFANAHFLVWNWLFPRFMIHNTSSMKRNDFG